jgi:DNA-directed RNA polymerase-3 subunit RPC5
MPASPEAVAVGSPEIVAVADSILPEEHADVLTAAEGAITPDVAGPSTLFLPDSEHTHTAPPPRAPSPALPNLADADDEDDEVAATLPVYFSPALHPSLVLFQYPLQHRSLRVPQWAADRGKRLTTRVKEGVGRVEIEVPIDGDARVWREERAKDLGFVPDVRENGHEERTSKKKGPEKWGDKMRLRSDVVPVPGGAQYYSGIVHEGEYCEEGSWRKRGAHGRTWDERSGCGRRDQPT